MYTTLSVRQKNLLRVVVFKFLVHYRYSAFMLKLLVTCQHAYEHELLFPRRIIAQVTEQAEAWGNFSSILNIMTFAYDNMLYVL